jgi:hypothetical protein
MRSGVSVSTPADVDRVRALVKDRDPPQKQSRGRRIVLLTAEGAGTNAITRETGKNPRPASGAGRNGSPPKA